jgi:ABC-type arginine transport system permease subunit
MGWIALQALFFHTVLLKTQPTLFLFLLFFVFVLLLCAAVKTAQPSVADVNALLFIYAVLAVLFSPFTADVVLVAFFAIFLMMTPTHIADHADPTDRKGE